LLIQFLLTPAIFAAEFSRCCLILRRRRHVTFDDAAVIFITRRRQPIRHAAISILICY
jgi:hypothetical protein